jgi:uncharacterized membrane protein
MSNRDLRGDLRAEEHLRRVAVFYLAAMVLVLVLSGCGRGSSKAPDSTTAIDSIPIRKTVPKPDSALVALGNEPFWNVRVTSRGIVYKDPEHQDGYQFPPVAPIEEGETKVYRTRRDVPAGDTGPRTLELRIRPGTCSDGMSDRQYSLTAELEIGDQKHAGCAWVEPVAGAAAPSR